MKNIFKKNIKVKHHIIFWCSYFFFNFLRWGIFYEDFNHSFRSNVLEFILHILITYFTVYYLIPKYILTKKYLTFVFLFVISLCIIYVLRTELSLILFERGIPEFDRKVYKSSYTLIHILSIMVGEMYVVAFTSALKFTVDWVYQKNKYIALKDSKLKMELELLKAQIQPHFFFNTLNNLYALTLEKSKKAPEVVLKLSEIMEYVLYDTGEPEIGLLKEINYINNYVDLEKLRFGDNLDVQVDLQGNLEDVMVPPLLFLSFIENCFKHGSVGGGKLNILISFEITNSNLLTFMVINNYNMHANKTPKNHVNSGIGNHNVLRRLELLYKDNFTLTIKTEKENYIVKLFIQL